MTPIAATANMTIMGPGGCQFGAYWRLRLIMVPLSFVVSVRLVPLV